MLKGKRKVRRKSEMFNLSAERTERQFRPMGALSNTSAYEGPTKRSMMDIRNAPSHAL